MCEEIRDSVELEKDAVETDELKDTEIAEGVAESGTPEGAESTAEFSELKDKAAEIMEDVKEKTATVVSKVKGAAEDVVSAVKDGVSKLASTEKPVLNVKNELFNELGEQVAAQKEAVAEKAADLQRQIEEILGKKE